MSSEKTYYLRLALLVPIMALFGCQAPIRSDKFPDCNPVKNRKAFTLDLPEQQKNFFSKQLNLRLFVFHFTGNQ